MKQVLYVEDQIDDVELLNIALSRLNLPVEVTRAADASEACNWLYLQTPRELTNLKFLLVDINLPGKSGLELILELRANPQYSNLPMIAFSTSENPSDVLRAYSVGANSYVIKPQAFEELLLTVKNVFNFWCLTNVRVSLSN